MVWVLVRHGPEGYHAQVIRPFESLFCRLVKAICYLLNMLVSPVTGVPQFVCLISVNVTCSHPILTHP